MCASVCRSGQRSMCLAESLPTQAEPSSPTELCFFRSFIPKDGLDELECFQNKDTEVKAACKKGLMKHPQSHWEASH